MSFEPPNLTGFSSEDPVDWTIYEDLINKCPMKEPALSVLKWKGLSESLIEIMNVGFIENVPTVFPDLTRKHGMDRLKKAGLVFRKGPHEGKYVFTFHRILFPFIEEEQVKFIRGMKIEKTSSWLYQDVLKNLSYIYNSDILKTLNPGDELNVTESILDCLVFLEKGKNAVGILGISKFKEEYLDLLKPYKVILHKDSANPDSEYSRQLASKLTNHGLTVSRGEMPELF